MASSRRYRPDQRWNAVQHRDRISPVPRPPRPVIPPRAISRVDRRGIHCWRVHLKRQGVSHLIHIHDHDHGGRAGARRVAAAALREALLTLPPPLRTSSHDVRSTTGEVGVSFERVVRPSGRVYRCYRVVWPLGNGRYKKRAFSIAKLGKRVAFKLAVRARQQGVAQLAKSLRERIQGEISSHPSLRTAR
jgi:hypothetical protein